MNVTFNLLRLFDNNWIVLILLPVVEKLKEIVLNNTDPALGIKMRTMQTWPSWSSMAARSRGAPPPPPPLLAPRHPRRRRSRRGRSGAAPWSSCSPASPCPWVHTPAIPCMWPSTSVLQMDKRETVLFHLISVHKCSWMMNVIVNCCCLCICQTDHLRLGWAMFGDSRLLLTKMAAGHSWSHTLSSSSWSGDLCTSWSCP